MIDGTVGYEFLNEVNGLFVDTPRLRAPTRVYRRFTGERTTFREIVYASKKLILLTSLASELNVLAHALNRISEADRRTRDFKMGAPGVTDVYQGNELWEFRLVDPDNRRAVDFDRRRMLLRDLRPLLDEAGGVQVGDRVAAVAEMLEHWEDGRIKLFVTACGLRLRRMYAALFLHGGYSPLKAEDESDEHVVALLRQHGTQRLIAAVPRLTASHIRSEHALPVGSETWGDALLHIPAALGASTFRNVFTGETVEAIAAGARIGLPLAQVFHTCPVALLYAG